MIAGRAPAKKFSGDSNNFGESVRYIARSGELREGQEPALAVWSQNVSSVKVAALEMELLAAQSRTKDPLYFFTASWSPGEKPTVEQAREAAEIYTKKLGFEGLQVVWSLQNDGKAGLYHIHGVFNLVDPETKTARSTWREGQKCREASRQVEFEQGWERADNRTKREQAREARERGLTIAQLRDLERPARLLEALTQHASTFSKADAETIIMERVKGATKAEKIARWKSTGEALMKLVVPLKDEQTGEMRFTSPAVQAAEQTVSTAAKAMHEANRPAIPHGPLPERFDDQQRAAVEYLLGGGSDVKVWLGVGGMGKTFVFDELLAACRRQGYDLQATSTDHSLVKQIVEKTDVRAATIASLVAKWKRGEDVPTSRSIILVDEVSKLGTAWGVDLLRVASERGAQVWLVGDHQFQAVGAGDTLRIVQKVEQGVDFSRTRRQRLDPADANPAWMREATEAMRRGEIRAGFEAYRQRGFVHEAGTEDEARAKTIDLWRAIVADGRECQIETFTNATRVALGELVRPELRALGKLAGDDVRLRTMDGVHFADGLVPFAIGERVIMRASVREAGVDNGDTGTVRGNTGAVLHVEREDGRLVAIDTRTEDGAMIQHATVRVEYGLQGRTLEATVQHFGANVSRRSAYTGASRHEAEYHAVMSREVFPEGFAGFVQRASRSSDKDLAMDFTVRDLAAEKREAQKQAKLHAAIEREREAAAERKAERGMNATMAFAIERELRDRGVRTISHDDIFKIMLEVREAASKIHYGSQTEIMANIVQEKLAPKQSRGMRR
jgi:hypothetical protein